MLQVNLRHFYLLVTVTCNALLWKQLLSPSPPHCSAAPRALHFKGQQKLTKWWKSAVPGQYSKTGKKKEAWPKKTTIYIQQWCWKRGLALVYFDTGKIFIAIRYQVTYPQEEQEKHKSLPGANWENNQKGSFAYCCSQKNPFQFPPLLC